MHSVSVGTQCGGRLSAAEHTDAWRKNGQGLRRPLTGCLVWILALLVILLVLSILFGGFQRGTKVSGDRPARPQAMSSVS